MNDLDILIEYLPFLVPLIILQFGLAVYAVVHIMKNPNYKFGNRTMWLLIAIFISLLGPIIYFMFGKEND